MSTNNNDSVAGAEPVSTKEFAFAKKFSDTAARSVPLERVSFGKNVKVQSEKEFLLWHAACCMNELAERAHEFSITVEQLARLKNVVEQLQAITASMANPQQEL